MKSLYAFIAMNVCVAGLIAAPQQSKDPCKSEYKQPRNMVSLFETYDLMGNTFGFRGDVLYMNYNSPVLTYASRTSLEGPDPHLLDSHIASIPGKMSLGCVVGVNYTMPNNPGYTFESNWYHIFARFHDSITANNVLLAHSIALTTSEPGKVRTKGHMQINFLDFLVEKSFSFGDWFNVMPAAGLMGGFMHSAIRSESWANSGDFGSSTTYAALDQFGKFEGIGVKLGGRTSYKIWRGFRLTGELFYSVMYGYTHASLQYSSNGTYVAGGDLGFADSDFMHHHGRSVIDSMVGFAWDTRFWDDDLYLDFHAGWRFQSFSDGWFDYEAEFDDAIRSLALEGQGLEAGVTFKF